jgi:hypothetical protein
MCGMLGAGFKWIELYGIRRVGVCQLNIADRIRSHLTEEAARWARTNTGLKVGSQLFGSCPESKP